MAPAPEKALYVGEAGCALADGTPLIPHETIAAVPRSEAEASELWEPVSGGTPASPNVRNADPSGRAPGAPEPGPEGTA